MSAGSLHETDRGPDASHFQSTTDTRRQPDVRQVSTEWFTLVPSTSRTNVGAKASSTRSELTAIGEQPGLRHFDIASRTGIASRFSPGHARRQRAVSASIAAARTTTWRVVRPARQHARVYGNGVDVTPTSASFCPRPIRSNAITRCPVAAGESRRAIHRSPRGTGHGRHDRVHALLASAEINRIAEKVNLRFGYDFSHARARYQYITGPVQDRTLPEEGFCLPHCHSDRVPRR